MAVGATYADVPQLKKYQKLPANKTDVDDQLLIALESASREIENHCHRQFNKETDVSTRVYEAAATRLVLVDDFWDTGSLVIRSGQVGSSFGSPWVTTAYELGPRNGVVNGVPGWPYRQLILPYTAWLWPTDRIEVTAKWGWADVPKPVRQACLILASQNYKVAGAPFNSVGLNSPGQGDGSLQIRDVPGAAKKLAPYVLSPVLVG